MADPICRWRNVTIKQVCEFTNILPHCAMPKAQAHEIINRNWMDWDGSGNFFKTAYQLAVSLGLYYEDDTTFYPRFSKALNFEESRIYLNGWMRRYYVPNPYTASVSDTNGIFVLNSLLLRIIDEGLFHTLKEALETTYDFTLGNEDIISNMLNMFSDIDVDNEGILSKKGQSSPINRIGIDVSKTDKKAFFEFFNDIPLTMIDYSQKNNTSRQIIYYGAPGTGKSNKIDQKTSEDNRIRTTFHPDSDYSTFVGAYKPTMKKQLVYEASGSVREEEQISYSFVPQAFIKAYCKAWERKSKDIKEPYYLVIEEINRGNCAQIFGDLFQLLDRDENGYSKYEISPDDDIQQHLAKVFKDFDNIPEPIKSGEVMKLPDNLYIWATMNTSDQSLFPIDSAFKRRWDWEYVPIKYNNVGWEIVLDKENKYKWTDFQRAVNDKLKEVATGEDKMLGDYFVIADEKNEISAKLLLNKILFYLWSDVCKDGEGEIFRLRTSEGEQKTTEVKFAELFLPTGEPDIEKLKQLMAALEVKPIGQNDNSETEQ